MNSITLIAVTLTLAVIFLAGLRERLINIPRWFANPPSSFELIRQQAPAAMRFWIPVQIIFIVTLIAAFVVNWEIRDVRLMLIFGTAAFFVVIALTGIYYVKEIMAFSKMPPDAPVTDELLKRAHRWYSTTVSRNIIQGIALLFFILATIKYFQS